MRWVDALRSWWHCRAARDEDIDREIRTHLQAETDDLQEHGLTAEEARDAARRAFGNTALVSEDVRAVWVGGAFDRLRQDVRFGARVLRRSPVFTVLTIASLALGIGATSALFSLFDAIVLRQLPVPDPDRLVVASLVTADGRTNYSMPYPQFDRMRQQTSVLDGMFAVSPVGRVTVTTGRQRDLTTALYVSGGYYDTLRLTPAAGRLLSPADDRPGVRVAVLGHGYWLRRFAGSPDVLGSAMSLNGVPFTIVGVEPRGFRGVEVGRLSDVTVPLHARDAMTDSPPLWDHAFATWLNLMGRLAPGVSLERAQATLDAAATAAAMDASLVERPGTPRATIEAHVRRWHIRLEPAATGVFSDLRAEYERWLRLLLALVAAVLLVACVNVAAMMVARSQARDREIATRIALGARRGRIVRQLLTESLLLAAIGGALGMLLAWRGGILLLRLATHAGDRLPVDLTPDWRVVLFTVAVSLVTCLVYGLLPALRSTRGVRLTPPGVVGGPRRGQVFDRALVALQVGVSLTIVICAGLFGRTLQNLWLQDTGYERTGVLMFSLDARLSGLRGPRVPSTYRRVLRALTALPSAQRVSLSSVRPVSTSYYFIESVSALGERRLPEGRHLRIAYNGIAPGYLATLGIPLVAGRDFDERDVEGSPPVAIVSERLARHFAGNPVGQRLTLHDEDELEIVGVARDSRYANVKDAPREVLYMPVFQSSPEAMWYAPTFEIRYRGTQAAVMRSARAVVERIDPTLVPFEVRTLETETLESLSRERLLAIITTYGAAFALLLACVGVYGVTSYGVARRTREIGLRVAVGAAPATVTLMFLREAAITVSVGIAIGLVMAVNVTHVLRSQLFGVGPGDPATYTTTVLLLAALAVGAALVPAWRASRSDPTTALRSD
jgi:predicted permease